MATKTRRKSQRTASKNGHVRESVGVRIVRALREDFGEDEAITAGAERDSAVRDWVSTQCFALNTAIGRPGIPCGRLTVIQGKEGSGKTTVATHIMAECQRRGGLAIYLDAEYAYDSERAATMGLFDADTLPEDTDLLPLVIIQPDHVEDAIAKIEAIIKRVRAESEELLTVIVWDSIAGTPTKAEVEGSIEDIHPGIHARKLSGALRRLTKLVATDRIALMFINQEKDKIGGFGFGGPQTTTIAEKPLGFHATVRIVTRQIGTIGKDKRSSTGILCRATITKNKVAPPFREAEFIIDYAKGIDDRNSRLQLAIQMGIVKKLRGGKYEFDGEEFRGAADDDTQAAIDAALAAARDAGTVKSVRLEADAEDEEED